MDLEEMLLEKTPKQAIGTVISYVLYVRQLKQRNNHDLDCIIAMDETAVARNDLQYYSYR